MTVRVRLFARARDLAGKESLAIELPAGATVDQLRNRLAVECPALSALLARCAVAVDNEFAQPDQSLADNAEVALLPPVSGG